MLSFAVISCTQGILDSEERHIGKNLRALEKISLTTAPQRDSVRLGLLALQPRVIRVQSGVLDSLYNAITLGLLSTSTGTTASRFRLLHNLLTTTSETRVTWSALGIGQYHRLGLNWERSRSSYITGLASNPPIHQLVGLLGNISMEYLRIGFQDPALQYANLATYYYRAVNQSIGLPWTFRLQYTAHVLRGDTLAARDALDSFREMYTIWRDVPGEDRFTTSINLVHDINTFGRAAQDMPRAFGDDAVDLQAAYDSLKNTTVRPWLTARSVLDVDDQIAYPKPIVREIPNTHATLLIADSLQYDASRGQLLHCPFGIYQLQGRSWVLLDSQTDPTKDQPDTAAVQDDTVKVCSSNITRLQYLTGKKLLVVTQDSVLVLDSTQHPIIAWRSPEQNVTTVSDGEQSNARTVQVEELSDSVVAIARSSGFSLLNHYSGQYRHFDTSLLDIADYYALESITAHTIGVASTDSTEFVVSTKGGKGRLRFDPATLQVSRTDARFALLIARDEYETIWNVYDRLRVFVDALAAGTGQMKSRLVHSVWSGSRILHRTPTANSDADTIAVIPAFETQWPMALQYETGSISVLSSPINHLVLARGSSVTMLDIPNKRAIQEHNLPVLSHTDHPKLTNVCSATALSSGDHPQVFFSLGKLILRRNLKSSWHSIEPKLVVEDLTARTIDTVELSTSRTNVDLTEKHRYRVSITSFSPLHALSLLPLSSQAAQHMMHDFTRSSSVLSFEATKMLTGESILIPYDNSRFTLSVVSPLYDQTWFLWLVTSIGIVSFVFSLLTLYRNARRRREDAIEQAKQEQMTVLREDMHDMIGSRLSRIASLSRQRDGKEVADQLDKIQEIALTTVRSLRNLLSLMAETNLTDAEFFGTVREFMVGACDDASVACTARVEVDEHSQLSSEDRHQLLMICSELVTNSIRHAQCSHTWLTINGDHGSYDIVWEDDGVGIDPAKPRGHGLNNVERRCGRIGADVSFVPRQPNGTMVMIHFSIGTGHH